MTEATMLDMLVESTEFGPTDELPENVQAILRVGLGRTPYLGGAPRHVLTPRTLGDLAEVFDYLVPLLREGAEKARQTQAELDGLRADLAAFRRVMGGVLGTA